MVNTLGKTLQNLPGPVLITGHTGFKGTWMTLLLQQLGIPIVGYSLKPEKDSLYERAKLKGQIPEKFADIRDYTKLKKFLFKHQPSAVIHMAAQPLVLESYKIPRKTFDVNIMGTTNLLDASFELSSVKIVLVVTSDKVYRNDDSVQSFIESDPLEGKDPYSASKVGTEAVVKAWQQISKNLGGPKVVSVRAGNVIGGGDLAKNRLIPDIVRSHISGEPLEIRNPHSIRPWQHVLDPIIGYLQVIENLIENYNHDFTSFNFGPLGESLSVNQVATLIQKYFAFEIKIELSNINNQKLESIYLGLDSSQAENVLKWKPKIDQRHAVMKTINWWNKHLQHDQNAKELCIQDIIEYFSIVE